MTKNTFFTSNQAKQHAYDRFYSSMARSDFIQGQKLKAKISQEALDNQMAEKLADLYVKTVEKTRQYSYDPVLGKLSKRPQAPPVQQDQAKPSKVPKVPVKVKTQSPQKRKFAFQYATTDPDLEEKAPIPTTPPSRKGSFKKKVSDLSDNDVNMSPAQKSPLRIPLKMNIKPKAKSASASNTEWKDIYDDDVGEHFDQYLDALLGTDQNANVDMTGIKKKLEDKGLINDINMKIASIDDDNKEKRSAMFKQRKQNSIESLREKEVERQKKAGEILRFLRRKEFNDFNNLEKGVIAREMFKRSNNDRKPVKTVDLTTDSKQRVSKSQKLAKAFKVDSNRKVLVINKQNKRGRANSASPSKVSDRLQKARRPDSPQKQIDFDDDSDDEESKAQVKEELGERAYNKKRFDEFKLMINSFPSKDAKSFYKQFKAQFGREINALIKKRDDINDKSTSKLFAKEFPEPKRGENIDRYTQKLIGNVYALYLYQ